MASMKKMMISTIIMTQLPATSERVIVLRQMYIFDNRNGTLGYIDVPLESLSKLWAISTALRSNVDVLDRESLSLKRNQRLATRPSEVAAVICQEGNRQAEAADDGFRNAESF